MIRSLARLSVGNAVAVNLATLVVVTAGAITYLDMPREVFPEFSLGTVRLLTTYPGASPEDVERLVTLPLEDEVGNLDGLDAMSSRSQEGLSTIHLQVDAGTDVRAFLEDVRAAVDRVQPDLPDEVDAPWVREVKTEWPVIAVFVYGHRSEAELRAIAERHQRRLEEIGGVSQVVLSGVREPRIWVEVDPLALERYGLTLDEVGRAVAARGRDLPTGTLSAPSGDFLLRVESGLLRADDLRSLPLRARPDGALVRLGQVARVHDTFERTEIRARFNGQPCMHLQVNKQAGGDALAISREVRDYVERARESLPEGVALGTNSDLSVYIRNRLAVMRQSAFLGGILVLISLVLFLSLRVALMTALGIPFAFLGGLLVAGTIGISMNMMTMFALIVVLGMVVDDAIVVGENVFRRMEAGEDPIRAAVEGTAEVGRPVVATILTTVAAFLPILLIEGTTGNFLRPLPILVSLCLAASLAEAVLVLPAHLAHWTGSHRAGSQRARRGREGGGAGAGTQGAPSRWYEPLRRRYVRFLERALHWRYVTLAATVAVATVAGGLAYHRIPFHLFDDFESKVFYVNLRAAPGTSVQTTEALARAVEAELLDLPASELESANTLVGIAYTDASRFTVGQNLAQVWVELREDSEDRRPTAAIIEDVRQLLRDPPAGIESVEIAQPQAGPTGRAIDVAVRGEDLAVLRALAADVRAELASLPGVRDVRDNAQEGKREVRLRLRDAGRTLGFSEAALAAELRTAFEGTPYARVRRGRDDVEVVVKLPEELRAERGVLERLRVSSPDGRRVPLGTVAALVETAGQAVITRDDGERSLRVTADVNKRESDAGTVTAALQQRFAALGERHPGYALEFKGDHEETRASFAGLARSIGIALLVIYVILGSLFRSTVQPLVVMFAIPFGGVGLVAGHLVMGRAISLMSLIGLLALAGIVVNDSLILIDFVNGLRRRGRSALEALVRAGELRFRPILLTTITTMLGLTPLTFFASGQARFLQPMAISIFFGIALATVLILVVVPCAYACLEDLVRLARRPRGTLSALWRECFPVQPVRRHGAGGSLARIARSEPRPRRPERSKRTHAPRRDVMNALPACLLLFCGTAHAADLYVDAIHGDDDTGTGSEVAPFRTITAALAESAVADTIHVAPGNYNEALGEVFPLTPPAAVTIQGASASLTSVSGAGSGTLFVLADRVSLSDITIQRGTTGVYSFQQHGEMRYLRRCVLRNNDAAIHYEDWIHSDSGFAVVNCVLRDNDVAVLHQSDWCDFNSVTLLVYGSTITGNGTFVEHVGLGCERYASVYKSILYGNDSETIPTFSAVDVVGNVLTDPNYVGKDGNVNVDPQWVEAGIGDFHLKPTSSVLDAPSPPIQWPPYVTWVGTGPWIWESAFEEIADIDGAPRAVDAAIDPGCDEVRLPTLYSAGSVNLGKVFDVRSQGEPSSSLALFFADSVFAAPLGGFLWLEPPLQYLTTWVHDADGTAGLAAPLADNPALVGVDLYFQGFQPTLEGLEFTLPLWVRLLP